MTLPGPLDHPVIPLAGITDPAQVDALGDGLVAGGLPVVEVAFRTDHAIPAIRRLAGRGDLSVGAGTVLTRAQAEQAIEAGAQFLVAPGLDLDLVEFAAQASVPIVPGVLTPSEVQAAARAGLDRLKVFPANAIDLTALLNAFADVYPQVRFMPSGGVGPADVAGLLAHRAVFAVSGSWIAKAAGQGSAAVADLARQAIASAP